MRNMATTQMASSFRKVTAQTNGVLQRKCAGCGNHTVAGSKCQECDEKRKLGIQAKLRVGEIGDAYEQEADRIADQVLAASPNPVINAAPPGIHRFAGPPAGGPVVAPASVDRTLSDSGNLLEPSLRQDMERRFGYDFSKVRVHTGAAA